MRPQWSLTRLADQLGLEIGQLPVVGGAATHEGTGTSSVVVTTSATGEPTHKATGSSSIVVSSTADGSLPYEPPDVVPVLVVTNDGWDTGPTPGGDIVDAIEAEDANFVTVTV